MIGWPVRSLCQIAAVKARTRCTTRTQTPAGVCPPCCSRLSWPLKVSLMDSMTCRNGLKNSFQPAGTRPCGPGAAAPARIRPGGLELTADVVLVPDHDLPGPSVGSARVGVEYPEQGLGFVGLGAGQGEPDGQPVQRAQQVQPQPPEVAGVAGAVAVLGHPANSEPSAASRDRAHSTGVESTTQTSSVHKVVSRASTPISQPIVEPSRRSRLL